MRTVQVNKLRILSYSIGVPGCLFPAHVALILLHERSVLRLTRVHGC